MIILIGEEKKGLRLLVLSPSETMTASASLELSTAIMDAAKPVLVLRPGMFTPPSLTQKLNLCAVISPRS